MGDLSYYDEGSGPTIIAVHGLPGSGRDFRWLAPALTPMSRFIRLDMPGFGGTPVSAMPGTTIDERARFVLDTADKLGVGRFAVLGHSMGGPVAARVAALAPERVFGLALVSSIGTRPHLLYRKIGFALHLTPMLRGPLAETLLRPLFARSGFRGPYGEGALVHTMRCVRAISFETHAQTVAGLKTPTLFAYCTDDPFIETEILDELAKVGPRGPRLRYNEGGHNPQKAQAVELGAALLSWLDRRP